MTKHKQKVCPTNDSERSPSVHYANWKETIFLGKKLATINKTEQGIVHRITVDQKVTYRRFQHMLNRTKIAQARAANDKETIKQLQGEILQKLHCESHLMNVEDASFLKKLERNPCTFDSAEDRKRFLEVKRNSAPKKSVTDQQMISLIQTVITDGDIEHTPDNLNNLAALGHILDAAKYDENDPLQNTTIYQSVSEKDKSKESHIFTVTGPSGEKEMTAPTLKQRSITNAGNERGDEFLGCRINPAKSLSARSMDNAKLRNTSSNSENSKEPGDLIQQDQNLRSPAHATTLPPVKSPAEKELNVIQIEPMNGESSISRTASHAGSLNRFGENNLLTPLARSPKETPRKKISSIFEEIKRPDIHGMRLQEAKEADYTGQVKDFIESLSTFGQGVPDFDYYASKMQLDAAQQVKSSLSSQLPSTPDHIYRKHTGNTSIKCITLPEIKLRKGEVNRHEDSHAYDLFYNDLISCGVSDISSSYSSDDDEGND